MTEKYYIRFGKIPKDENSKEYKHRKEIDTVLGVSCFDCFIDSNNIPHVIVPNPINIECVEDLY